MKVIVTGASGLLGTELVNVLEQRHEVFGMDHHQLDITNYNMCEQLISSIQPDVIIHCAAYTSVDLAETEQDQAYLVNANGTRNIALIAENIGAKLCYISTDYVFDGSHTTPYTEHDQTNPRSIYGKTKRDGELFIQTICSNYYIVRTSWMFGLHGNNFVKTMLNLAQDRDIIQVVEDQYGSPTYSLDLSYFLLQLIETDKYGIYHVTNGGSCSWYEFATAIFEESNKLTRVESCSTTDFPRPAPRPQYSVLDNMSIRANGFTQLRHWREALIDFLQELKVRS
ncbi:MAG: dTDP-4-dehydrorhamnose reductase [Paenibacillaceae bacterium]